MHSNIPKIITQIFLKQSPRHDFWNIYWGLQITNKHDTSHSEISSFNSAEYSLVGAKYGLYSESSLKTTLTTLTTDASGSARVDNLHCGTSGKKSNENGQAKLDDAHKAAGYTQSDFFTYTDTEGKTRACLPVGTVFIGEGKLQKVMFKISRLNV